MGITDKISHAAEELKEKGQEALHKVTGKDSDATDRPLAEGRGPNTDAMQVPAPNKAPNQDPTGKVEPGRR